MKYPRQDPEYTVHLGVLYSTVKIKINTIEWKKFLMKEIILYKHLPSGGRFRYFKFRNDTISNVNNNFFTTDFIVDIGFSDYRLVFVIF